MFGSLRYRGRADAYKVYFNGFGGCAERFLRIRIVNAKTMAALSASYSAAWS